MLVVNDISVNYDSASALRNVSLQVNQGEIVAVIGRNGAGKTTLLKAITGLLKLKEGKVEYNEKNISNIPAYKIVEYGISHVPQGRQIFGDQTVEDNLILGSFSIRKEKEKVLKLLEEQFERFPRLKERRKQIAGTLSGGEQQMLAISRALMSNPRFMLLDEPSMGLSPLYVKQIFDILQELKSEGRTVLVVEQLAKAALSISDRAYVLQTGEVIYSGISKNLLEDEALINTYLGA